MSERCCRNCEFCETPIRGFKDVGRCYGLPPNLMEKDSFEPPRPLICLDDRACSLFSLRIGDHDNEG